MIQILSIAPRFCGPPDSGNGGYVCGRLAAFVEGPAVVRLQVPPPLDVEMEVRPADDGVDMVHGDTVVATARPAQVALDAPPPPSYADAEAAARSYAGFRTHFFPTCFRMRAIPQAGRRAADLSRQAARHEPGGGSVDSARIVGLRRRQGAAGIPLGGPLTARARSRATFRTGLP